MIENLIIKINNNIYSGDITDPYFTNDPVSIYDNLFIDWDFDKQTVSTILDNTFENTYSVEQLFYDIRIGTLSSGWGTDFFIGDIYSDIAFSQYQRFKIDIDSFDRGVAYYGQIMVGDRLQQVSLWGIFSFRYKDAPSALSVSISPLEPTLSSNLELSYNFDADTGLDDESIIRWYKNSVFQSQFNNKVTVPSDFLSYGDIWSAYVTPYDGFEYGSKVQSNIVTVSSQPPSSDSLNILPAFPTDNDILRAEYSFDGDQIEDQSILRWYVNGSLIKTVVGSRYVRLDVLPGDEVFYTLVPYDGVSYGTAVSSEKRTILASAFNVKNIFINNLKLYKSNDVNFSPVIIYNSSPVFKWENSGPLGYQPTYANIKIGTYSLGNDIVDEIINLSGKYSSYNIPENTLDTGVDYFVSIACSNIASSFDAYEVYSFRVNGSRWSVAANNSTGWTVDIALKYPYPESSTDIFDGEKYHAVSIKDGTRFGEVRFYNKKISFFSQEEIFSTELSSQNISQDFDIITISGVGDDVKIYLNRILILDCSGYFVSSTTSRSLDIIAFGLDAFYKNINYTVSGSLTPLSGNSFISSGYESLFKQRGSGVSGISRYKNVTTDDNGKNVYSYKTYFATTPVEATESSKIYEIDTDETFIETSAINMSFTPINNISVSEDGVVTGISQSRGFTLVKNFPIYDWDYDIDFREVTSVTDFELVSNTPVDAGYFNTSGLYIVTTSDNLNSE